MIPVQLLYKHSVQKASSIRALSLSVVNTVLLGKTSSDGDEYICCTCSKYNHQNKIPPSSIANNLQFAQVPSHLATLNAVEWRLLSPRLAFMQIRESSNC